MSGGGEWQLGDEGSGAWLGKEALRLVMLGFDGRADPTSLTQMILDSFQLENEMDIIPLVYSPEWNASKYGEIAPLVLAAAENDPIVLRLVQIGASHLARHLVALQSRLGGKSVVSDVAFSRGIDRQRYDASTRTGSRDRTHWHPSCRTVPIFACNWCSAARIEIIMCGIAGIIGRSPALSPPKPWLDAMGDRMAHRGPDGSGNFHR